jgi:hypothetical protein
MRGVIDSTGSIDFNVHDQDMKVFWCIESLIGSSSTLMG